MTMIQQYKKYSLILLVICGLLISLSAQGWAEISLEDIKEYAKAVAMIGNLQRQTPVDWDTIRAQYDSISPLIKAMDANWKKGYDQEIRQAIEQCAAGDNVDENKQTIGKGLQHVAVLGITQELNTLGKSLF